MHESGKREAGRKYGGGGKKGRYVGEEGEKAEQAGRTDRGK